RKKATAAASSKATRKRRTVATVSSAPARKRTVAATPSAAPHKKTAAGLSAAARAAALARVNAALEDPPERVFEQAGALAPVFEQLLRMSANGNQPPMHVIQFGDSHTAADEMTGALRDEFQRRFGDGGSG